MPNSLEDVEVGDQIVVRGGNQPEQLSRVTKVTKTQIHTRYMRFRKKDGDQVAATGWYTYFASVPTNSELQKIKEQMEKKQIIDGLKNWDWKNLSIDNLLEVDNLLRSFQKPKQ